MRRLALSLCLAVGLFATGASAQHLGMKGLFCTNGGQPNEEGIYTLHNFSSTPGTVEVVLVAYNWTHEWIKGLPKLSMTYNGVVPGPQINANLGDRIIIHFYNFTGEDTTVHWHGMELPATMDGSHISQLPVAKHGGYFKYEFDALRAATYWYHPHVNTRWQVERGLYGPIIVHDTAENSKLSLPAKERTLFFDDILLDSFLALEPQWPAAPIDRALEQLNGREGTHLLVNGQTSRTINMTAGVPERWRVINSSNARFQRFCIQGHTLYQIGGDGGLLSVPQAKQPIGKVLDLSHSPPKLISDPDRNLGILLGPGERAEVVFTPLTSGPVTVEWHDLHRGRHSLVQNGPNWMIGHLHADGEGQELPLMTANVAAGQNPQTWIPPQSLRPVTPIQFDANTPLMMVMLGHGLPDAQGEVPMFAAMKSGAPLPFPKVTSADAMKVKVGDTRVWMVMNMGGADHPFHAHGWFFQPISLMYQDDNDPTKNKMMMFPTREWKDTIIVPKRPGAKGSSRTMLRAAVKFDDTGRVGQVYAAGKTPSATKSGGWLFHCHIMEHSAKGMMSFFEVVP